jgi:hypothetical protein
LKGEVCGSKLLDSLLVRDLLSAKKLIIDYKSSRCFSDEKILFVMESVGDPRKKGLPVRAGRP